MSNERAREGEGGGEAGRRYVELDRGASKAVQRRPSHILSGVEALGDQGGRSGEDRSLERVDMDGTATSKSSSCVRRN